MKSLFALKFNFVAFCIIQAFATRAVSQAYPLATELRPSLYPSNPKATCPIEIIPNKSIGQIRLGMTQKQIDTLGLAIHETNDSEWFIVGPYSVRIDPKLHQVIQIEAELRDLPACVQYIQKPVASAATETSLIALFHDCQKTEHRMGGNLTPCQGLDVGSGGSGGKGGTSLRIPSYTSLLGPGNG